MNTLTQENDFGFLNVTNNWDNHRPMLLLGLRLTNSAVYEYGAGMGSTPMLRRYCAIHNREFQSFDTNPDWASLMQSRYIADANDFPMPPLYSMAFVDHAPGEHRAIFVQKIRQVCNIIVLHDTELGGAGDYKFEPLIESFAFKLHLNRNGGGAGCSMLSDYIDVGEYSEKQIGRFKFD